jgi:hypothetical protein
MESPLKSFNSNLAQINFAKGVLIFLFNFKTSDFYELDEPCNLQKKLNGTQFP